MPPPPTIGCRKLCTHLCRVGQPRAQTCEPGHGPKVVLYFTGHGVTKAPFGSDPFLKAQGLALGEPLFCNLPLNHRARNPLGL